MASFTTICNRKLCSTIALTEDRFDMALAPRFFNADVAQMVEHSLCMRDIRGSMLRISNFSEEPGNKKGNTGSCFVRPKEDLDLYVHYAKGSIWNSTELAEKAIGDPKHQGLPHKDVEGNIAPLISEPKTSLWHKQHHWTPPVRHVGPHQWGMSTERASGWHVRNTWIDDSHQQSQFYDDVQ